MRLLLILLAIVELVFASQAFAADEPIVFRKNDEACYRIPSLALTNSGYLAVVEHRRGIRGRRVCGDDGTVDLVGKTSSNGETWSSEHTIVSSDVIGEKLATPNSRIYDPAFSKIPAEDRIVRVGNQGLVSVGNDVYLMFVTQYNIQAQCGDREVCVNSPENLQDGDVKARYFLIKSADGGRTWSEPQRVHSAIYAACAADLIKDAGLRRAVAPFLADDAKADPNAYEKFTDIADALGYRKDVDANAAAKLLGVSASTIEADGRGLQQLFKPNIRVGPGNGVAFPFNGGTRLFFAGAPVPFYTDDGGRTFHCSNAEAIQHGGERQAAWVGGDTLVMSLRLVGGKKGDASNVRMFSISHDGGATWSADKPITANGHELIPDAIAQASIAGIEGSNPPSMLHINLANTDEGVGREGHKKKRGAKRLDYRRNLSAVRIYVEPSGLMPATTNGCAPSDNGSNVAYESIYPGSAGYSSAVYSPSKNTVGLLFEASDDDGPQLAWRSWNESVRFTAIPISGMKGKMPSAQSCNAK